MAARYIIFDGHIPVVFPEGVSWRLVMHAFVDHSLATRQTASGTCYYDSSRGWYCLKYLEDISSWIHDKESSEILNRHLCN